MSKASMAFTAHGISYDPSRVELLARNGYQLDLTDDHEVFVNGNHPNVDLTHLDEPDDIIAGFGGMVAHDRVDDDADPVMVYWLGDRMVAWLDWENGVGYIPAG